MNIELNFPPNFEGLVLGCIEAKVCKKILVGKLSPRTTQCTPLHRFGIRNGKISGKPPRGPNPWGRKNAPGPNNPRKYEKNERRSINSLPNTSAKISCAEKTQDNESRMFLFFLFSISSSFGPVFFCSAPFSNLKSFFKIFNFLFFRKVCQNFADFSPNR